jgi:hypothetical protein
MRTLSARVTPARRPHNSSDDVDVVWLQARSMPIKHCSIGRLEMSCEKRGVEQWRSGPIPEQALLCQGQFVAVLS